MTNDMWADNSPTEDDLETWWAQPRIVVGPVLRRVRGHSISVWVATTAELNLSLKVRLAGTSEWNMPPPGYDSGVDEWGSAGVDEVRCAPNLWSYMLKRAFSWIEPRQIYEYSLWVDGAPSPLGVDRYRLSNNSTGPGYPTFIIESQSPHGSTFNADGSVNDPGDPIPFAVSSGNKLHGSGRQSAAELLRDDLRKDGGNVNERYRALLLLGDQIFADDVAEELVPRIRAIARQINPQYEPLVNAYSGLVDVVAGMNLVASESATPKSNHLIYFEEFCAMYILTWSSRCWPNTSERQGWRQQLDVGWRGVRAMEAVLANLPLYTLIDDHEVTEDWNINSHWQSQGNPQRTDVIEAALAAYDIFQGWGNHSTNESPSIANAAVAGPGKVTKTTTPHLLGPYVTESPPYVLMLDTRTKRTSPSAAPDQRPTLIDASDPELTGLVQTLVSIRQTNGWFPIVASPSPVAMSKRVINASTPTDGPESYASPDFDSWEGGRENVDALVSIAQQLGSHIVFLGGNVRHSYGRIMHLDTDPQFDRMVNGSRRPAKDHFASGHIDQPSTGLTWQLKTSAETLRRRIAPPSVTVAAFACGPMQNRLGPRELVSTINDSFVRNSYWALRVRSDGQVMGVAHLVKWMLGDSRHVFFVQHKPPYGLGVAPPDGSRAIGSVDKGGSVWRYRSVFEMHNS